MKCSFQELSEFLRVLSLGQVASFWLHTNSQALLEIKYYLYLLTKKNFCPYRHTLHTLLICKAFGDSYISVLSVTSIYC